MRRWVPLLVLAVVLALPAGASANAYTEVQQVYAQAGTGQLPACQFSSAELEAALKQAPSYTFQYQSDFTDAIEAALASRANGDCLTRGSAAVTSQSALGPGAHLRSADLRLPTSLTAASSAGLPVVLAALFILVGALLVCLAGWFGFSALGREPRGIQAARHALREAEYRIGAGWEDLSDRLRRRDAAN